MKHFYSDIIEIETLIVELDTLDISPQEKKHLIQIASDTLHHTILDIILSELSVDDKEIFLQNHAENNHDKIWSHLQDKITHIESKIKITAEMLKTELHNDLKAIKDN
ncbi:MAG: hypothetical protein M3Q44_06495 [bacterium]|nr:hypothetical protein [bacterium]